MKKILLLALLCIAFTSVDAQPPTITNETCCEFVITPICYVPDHPCLSSITYGSPIRIGCHDTGVPIPPDDCVAPAVRGYQVCYTSATCDPNTQCAFFGGPDMCLGPWVILDPCVNCGPLGLTKISLDPITGNITISDYYWP